MERSKAKSSASGGIDIIGIIGGNDSSSSKEQIYTSVTADSGHGGGGIAIGGSPADPSGYWSVEDMSKTLCWLSK